MLLVKVKVMNSKIEIYTGSYMDYSKDTEPDEFRPYSDVMRKRLMKLKAKRVTLLIFMYYNTFFGNEL